MMFEKYRSMRIDETRESFDTSGHYLIDISTMLKTEPVRLIEENIEIDCMTQERLGNFVQDMEEEMRKMENEDINMHKIDTAMTAAANKHTKKKIRKRNHRKERGRQDAVWMNRNIREEIKLRKRYNRLKRSNLDPNTEEQFKKRYQEQKMKVKELVREEITKHELKITDEIKRDRNRKLWENINYLRGKSKTKSTEAHVYDENGNKIPEDKAKESRTSYWKSIYRKSENDIDDICSRTKDHYAQDLENEDVEVNDHRFHHSIQEHHMDYALKTEPEARYIMPMNAPIITPTQLKNQIRKMKNRKAPGNNNLPAELYKELSKSETCLEKMTKAMNNTVIHKDVPENWSASKTNSYRKLKSQL